VQSPPSKTFVASDLHLGHKNSLRWTNPREEGYEERFLKGWEAVVSDKDAVILLGDIAFSSKSYWFGRLAELPGKKVLMLGNHDTNKLNWYKKWGFSEVIPFNEYMLLKYYLGENGKRDKDYMAYHGNIMLSHIPAFPPVTKSYDDRFLGLSHKFQRAFDHASCILNIHGHTQGRAKEKHNTFDATLDVIGEQLVTVDQIFDHKFRNK